MNFVSCHHIVYSVFIQILTKEVLHATSITHFNIFTEGSSNTRNTGIQPQSLLDDPLKVLHLTEISHCDRAVRPLEDAFLLLVCLLLITHKRRGIINSKVPEHLHLHVYCLLKETELSSLVKHILYFHVLLPLLTLLLSSSFHLFIISLFLPTFLPPSPSDERVSLHHHYA